MTYFKIVKYNDGSNQELDQRNEIMSGDLITLQNCLSGLYLAIKKSDPKKIVMGHLEDETCEFLFIFEKYERKLDDIIYYKEPFKIRSFNGGVVSLILDNEFQFERFDSSNSENVFEEDSEELDRHDVLRDIIKIDNGLITSSLENSFSEKINKIIVFEAYRISMFDQDLVSTLKELIDGLLSFYIYFQNWGYLLGSKMKGSYQSFAEFKIVDDLYYYSYEEANEKQGELVEKIKRLSRTLGKANNLLGAYQCLTDIPPLLLLEDPRLIYTIKQKGIRDSNIIQFLTHFLRLVLQKVFYSLNIPDRYSYKLDGDSTRRSTHGSSALQRIMIPGGKMPWGKVKYTPQYIALEKLRKPIQSILEIIYLGILENPDNVESVEKYNKEFYFLMSFERKRCFRILLEISKFKNYSTETHVIDWISKLEVVGEKNNNIDDQIKYLKILKELCKDHGMNKELRKVQKKIRIQLFNIGTNPKKIGVVNFRLLEEKSVGSVSFYKPQNRIQLYLM